ncbi:5-(carboxyamino)imidazole ribonucleotide mutase [Heliorestis acidaminivorans]|uniref:N5-carboxyaminoimidazole ribonucleotide mutase n=2 Tax=Heliorestis acidaminivorans TaxID=553427 RepID=A0A6I0EXX3_9FIRM|nr:5-(carboxyamino)imidazole ribonucleotide mutase [Heliorestis acidaminivorans]KAB2953261.1 5-(carboxyamino)imidazole ribonucleotide mutase [Heliorestis acidaminivorans]
MVGLLMGSKSDWPIMKEAAIILEQLGVPCESQVVSAHRTPDWMFQYAEKAREKGIKVIIAGAGGAAHLPGMVASKTTLPVIGVPIPATKLEGMDALLSIVQMPGGVPVATMAIGIPGAKNAGLMAARILSINDSALEARLEEYKAKEARKVMEANEEGLPL